VLLEYIAYAEENLINYRILFMSVEPIAELKKTRRELQENNPAFRTLFKRVEACISAKVLQGDAFAVSTVLWSGTHGAAAILITQQIFPFSSRKQYAEGVIATLLAGVQQRVITI
jgi:Tetracyclin repressor-like, C-terminal domain